MGENIYFSFALSMDSHNELNAELSFLIIALKEIVMPHYSFSKRDDSILCYRIFMSC